MKTARVHWEISQNAKDWITRQTNEQGVSARVIIDMLIKTFEDHAEQDTKEALMLAIREY